MAIFYGTDQFPGFHKAVITIGTFDGIHEGHKKILHEVVKHASLEGGESIVITFDPHPRKLLFPDQPLKLINSLEQRLQLIQETGIQHIVVVPFTKVFSKQSASDYIEHFLVKYFHPKTIIIGYDHHFGHDRKGDISYLKKMEATFDYKVFEIPAQLVDESTISSTKIRKALLEGKVEEGALMMGRYYSLSGKVIKGAQLGRTIGYPTANIEPTDKDQLIPAQGVYAVRVKHHEHLHNGMLNIGCKPTVSNKQNLSIEVNIFDFDQNIYDQNIETIFIGRLRDEQKFNSLDDLKKQLAQDKINALRILSNNL